MEQKDFTLRLNNVKIHYGKAEAVQGIKLDVAEGSITVLQKELVAVGIATAIQCEPCIKLHVKKCFDASATKEQVIEAACVAVMMSGGPAYTHIPMVIDTLETLLTD